MKVNDLIFKELLKRGYSLEGNTRVWNIADSKLWYLTSEQAQAYLDLEKSENYKKAMTDKEIEILKKSMPEISKKVSSDQGMNIIDMGCGNGKKAITLTEAFNEKSKIKYCPIDISSHMVKEAIKNMKNFGKGDVVEFEWNISDFENIENVSKILKNQEFNKNFFLFLGNTLGNFEIHEVMYELVDAMDNEEYVLIGMALAKPGSDEHTKNFNINKKADNFLVQVLTQIGFEKDEVEYGLRFKNNRRESYYTIKKDKKIILGEKFIAFYKGDQILVGVSYRYTIEKLKEMMDLYFGEFDAYLNDDGTWVLLLCKKSED